jgi:16S rRNA (guanine966-N2)-methyltransferase
MFSSLDSALRADALEWSDVVVLDLFAGSGALGLEAASRGARAVTLVEKSRPAAKVLAANISTVGGDGVRLVVRDVVRLSDTPPAVAATMVFADPPYSWPAADLARVLVRLHAAGWVGDDAIVVAERPGRDGEAPFPDTWSVTAQRAYGDTALWYGRSGGSQDPGVEGS